CQNALTAAVSAGGGIVYFPPGNYKVTGLSVTLTTTRLKIMGAGQESTITNAATGSGTTSKCCLYINAIGNFTTGANWIEIDDLRLVGNGAAGGAGVFLDQIPQGRLANIRASGFTNGATYGTGIYMRDCIAVEVAMPVSTENTNGIVLT